MPFVREYQYQRINGYFNCSKAAYASVAYQTRNCQFGVSVETGRKSAPWWLQVPDVWQSRGGRTSHLPQRLANVSALQFQPSPRGCLWCVLPHKAVQPPSLPEVRPLHHYLRHDRRNWTCIQQTLWNLSRCKREGSEHHGGRNSICNGKGHVQYVWILWVPEQHRLLRRLVV